MTAKKILLLAAVFISFFNISAQIIINTQKIPLIQEPEHSDLIFRQFKEDADYNATVIPGVESYNKDGSIRKKLITFYRLKVPEKFDFLWLSSRLSPVYKDTLASINGFSSSDQEIAGKTVIVPSFNGLFIKEKPVSDWELMLYNQYIASAPESHQETFIINGQKYFFFEREKFNSTITMFFLDTNIKCPVEKSILTSNFGYRISPVSGKWKFHSGIDLAAAEGTNVFACKTGQVKTCGYNETYGNYIIIQHYNGLTSTYAHLSKILVAKGQKLNSGALIGKVGTTGASTGPHLHFELRKNGTPENPEKHISIH